MAANIESSVEGGVRTIRIKKESDLNPLDLETLEEIKAEMEKQVFITVLTGSPRAFSAGANINKFKGLSGEEAYALSRTGHSVMDFISEYGAPVIAAINGYALGGGCELALACDLRIAGKNTKMGLTELNIGIIPGWGGTQRLKKLCGEELAFFLISTSKVMTGEEAHEYGLVLEIAENPYERAIEIAKVLATKASNTLGYVKKLVRTEADSMFEEEMTMFGKSFDNENSKEGVAAFLEKRKPSFH